MDENNRIYNFIERLNAEQLENKKQNWVNSSLYCFNRKIFDYIPPLNGEITDFPNHIFPKLIEKNKLYGFALNGYRCAIDSPERYFIVQSDYKKGLIFDF
ncbi:MAG: hypothetical protein MZV64_27540 [Ignavibacteriales bacterium]|nr:hypothetical protein [Ignavibacteriales bacterium]